jgi:hypothetical protein
MLISNNFSPYTICIYILLDTDEENHLGCGDKGDTLGNFIQGRLSERSGRNMRSRRNMRSGRNMRIGRGGLEIKCLAGRRMDSTNY